MFELFCMILGRKSKPEEVPSKCLTDIYVALDFCLLGPKLQCQIAFVLS